MQDQAQRAKMPEVTTGISDGIGTIVLHRPERRNALNIEIKCAIAHSVTQLEADDAVQVIIITGTESYFVAGTDIAEMVDMRSEDHLALDTGGVFRALRAARKPTIAAVEGYALGGGCELAMCCDLIIAGETAQFGQPEIRVGIMPGAGGTQNFARALGRHRALKLLLTGDAVSAQEALQMGLISEVVPAGTALVAARELAATLRAMPPLGVAAIRRLVRTGPDMPMAEALEWERQCFMQLFDSEDQKEGMRAFLEKRAPQYKGQ